MLFGLKEKEKRKKQKKNHILPILQTLVLHFGQFPLTISLPEAVFCCFGSFI